MSTGSHEAKAAGAVSPPSMDRAPNALVQRRCACGGKAGPDGECAACRRRRLAPDSVGQVLGGAGRPLDEAARSDLEGFFAHDFSHVRVHVDGAADRSARAVGARAFTVGQRIVFAAGQYRPADAAGRRLLAHELTHTLQQGAHALSPSGAALEVGRPDDALERAAERSAGALGRGGPPPALGGHVPAKVQRVPFGRQAIDGESRGEPGEPRDAGSLPEGDTLPYREATEYQRCLEFFSGSETPVVCRPARPLTWADFGDAPRRARFDAQTRPDLRLEQFVSGTDQCRETVLGETPTPRPTVIAFLDTARTWVRPRWRNASDPAQNTCDTRVGDCERFFDREAAAGRSGGTQGIGVRARCPATVRPDASAVARSRDDCSSILMPACIAREEAESQRILRHEQLHFDLGCTLATKANQLIAAGGDPGAVLNGARRLLQPLHDRLDHDTDHGCLQGPQDAWEERIDRGLPSVVIRPQAPRRRRRGRRRRRRRRR